ncbi:MAG: hypothetical protein ABI629_09110, partial [bacterium]
MAAEKTFTAGVGRAILVLLLAMSLASQAKAQTPHCTGSPSDPLCWDTFVAESQCISLTQRKIYSRLWNISGNWNATCLVTPADFTYLGKPYHFDEPSNCVDKGISGEFGEFYINDPSCGPHWNTFVKDVCLDVGSRKWYSRLENIPPGANWNTACLATAADVAGVHFDHPSNCVDRGIEGEFGEFYVPDAECAPRWNAFVPEGCVAPGIRNYYARLDNIPPGLNWDATCLMTPADVAGTHFDRPTKCEDKGVAGEFGEFHVPDPSGCPSTPCGGEGQRACCDNDLQVIREWPGGYRCEHGQETPFLQEVKPCRPPGFPFDGATDDCACDTPGDTPRGRCVPVWPCGNNGQRACLTYEGHCQDDTQYCREDSDCANGKCWREGCNTQVPGQIGGSQAIQQVQICSGDCTPGDASFGLEGNYGKSTQSCYIPEDKYRQLTALNPTSYPPLTEPQTGRVTAQTPPAGKRGYADLHVHLFGNMASGGGAVAGAPYVRNPLDDSGFSGGVAAALKQCLATTFNGSPSRTVRCCFLTSGNGSGPPQCEDRSAAACSQAGGLDISALMGPELDLVYKACDPLASACDGGANNLQLCSSNAECQTGVQCRPINPWLGDCAEADVGGCPSYLPNCGNVLLHGDHALDFSLTPVEPLGAGTGDRDAYDWDIVSNRAQSNLGWPLFNGWPNYSTTTHQQTYYKWLERAWQGGLRLIVNHAVSNEALCKGSKHVRSVGLYSGCEDSMASIDAQIAATYDLQAFIDSQAGGPGKGWFRIVTTPDEAGAVIEQGKLAVVIGIEVDNLFNCKLGECTPAYVQQEVDKYYAMGVRHIFPVHNFENAFGAPSTWQDILNPGNKVSEGQWLTAEECSDEGYTFKLKKPFSDKPGIIQPLLDFWAFGHLFEPPGEPDGGFERAYPQTATCNSHGLSNLGSVLVESLMAKGITIDIDHLSNKGIDELVEIAEARTPPYPLVAGHVVLFDRHLAKIRHERMRTRAQLEKIKALGGMIALMTNDELKAA